MGSFWDSVGAAWASEGSFMGSVGVNGDSDSESEMGLFKVSVGPATQFNGFFPGTGRFFP